MVNLTPEIAPEIVAACQASAESLGATLGSALDGLFAVTIGEAAAYDMSEPPTGFDGPGLAILLRFGEVGAVAILPESTGHLPEWYAAPDATGKAKLSTLAQELSMLLVPESFMADEFSAARVDVLSAALKRGRVAAGAVHLPLALERDGKAGHLTFIWPIAEPAALLAISEAGGEMADASIAPAPVAPQVEAAPTRNHALPIPTYSDNVLKITVPVTVTLASQRKSIREIIELGPGSIVKFEKTCDQALDLCIGERRIAVGEVVKVGDKFGFKVGEFVGAVVESRA